MAERSVSVALRAKVADYIAGMKSAGLATRGLGDEIGKAGKTAKGIEDDLDRVVDSAAAAIGRTASAVSKLDREILTARTTLKGLAHDFANAEDEASRVDLAERIRKQHDELRKLLSTRSLLGGDEALKAGRRWGTKLAEGIASGLTDLGGNLAGGLPPQAQLAIGAAVVGAGVAAAPLLGAAISGAVVGGVGIGGVVGGLVLAAKDPRVQGVAAEVGRDLGDVLGRSSASFVPVTLDALKQIRGGIDGLEGEFKAVFDSASRYVEPLTEGALGFVRELMPGIESAIGQAGPVIDELASWGPKLGRLGSDFLSDMADHADEGAAALHQLFAFVDGGTRSLSMTIGTLADVYGWLDRLNDLTGGSSIEILDELFKRWDDTGRVMRNFPPIAEQVGASMQATADLTRYGSAELELYRETMSRMAREGQSAFDTETRLGAAIDKATKLARDGKDTLDAHSKAGRDNRNALSDLAAATLAAASAAGQLTGSQAATQAKIDEGYVKFIAAARGMGLSKKAADELARSLGLIPSPSVSVTVNTKQANTAIANVISYLDSVDGKTVTTSIRVQTIGDTDHISTGSGGGRSTERWGGVYEHAAEGALRESAIYSPQSPARYAFAEPATGGELFAPRFGDMSRTRAMVSHAVENWWGGWGNFAPQAGGGGPVTVAAPEVHVYIDGQEFRGMVHVELRDHDRQIARRAKMLAR